MARCVGKQGNNETLMARGLASDAQALAALGAPGVEHGTAAAGLHADEKTVRASALDLGRLVGALHGWPVTVVAIKAGLGEEGFRTQRGLWLLGAGPLGKWLSLRLPWLRSWLLACRAAGSFFAARQTSLNPGNP